MRLSLGGRTSLTVRLTVLFAAASTAVLLFLAYLVAASVEQHFKEQDMAVLNGKLELVAHALRNARSEDELARLPATLADSLVGHHSLDVLVIAPSGAVLFSTKGAWFPENVLRTAGSTAGASVVWAKSRDHAVRGIVKFSATGIAGASPATIAVATNIGHHERFMEGFRRTLWGVATLGAMLTGLLGWAAARRGLAPLRAMGREVGAITARRLDSRLSADAVPAELAELADTLNGMLARLENSFMRLSNFSSDLAHELRTPVSNLLTQTQVSLSKSRTVDEYRDILASNAEECEHLARMVSDMLFLAKSDNDLVVPNREAVSLANEVRSVLEFYEALAEEKGIVVALVGQASMLGDRLMIRRAINNLMSNAVRHTTPGGTITVRILDHARSGIELQVENVGEGIAAEHIPRLFDRFYRIDFARQRQSEGAGLGLAITRSIVRAHGGEAAVYSENGLSTFCLKFPG
ncbi:MAG: heavy metal sensor histidine kinase [Pseudomonadota bacterium]